MKKNLFYILLSFLIISCSGYEFVYKGDPIVEELKNKTVLVVGGDEIPKITSLLKQKLGKVDNTLYSLSVFVEKTVTPITIDKDGTASKIEIKNVGTYVLKKSEDDCHITNKKIYTKSTYNSATSGYDFGADVSRDDILEKNLKENIDGFFYYITSEFDLLECSDES
jgi:hypothetical protein